MSETAKDINWKSYSILSIIVMAVITAAAVYTQLWVITAIPIGFLFGFFLKKGELCGASAMSEIILLKDRSKIYGLWIAIVVSMVLFALFDLMGLIKLNPKPFIYLNYIVGGVLFGTGIVLAGGCVSGCLFKAGAGNINSMAGLVGIPLGIGLVEHGYLNGFSTYLKSYIVKSDNGGSVTLSSITGMPYWLLACIFIIITITAAVLYRKKASNKSTVIKDETGAVKRTVTRSWRPWKAGIAIGVLAIFAYLSSASTGRNYPLGVSHGVLHAQMLLTENNLTFAYKKPEKKNVSLDKQKADITQTSSKQKPLPTAQNKGKKVNVWLMLLITSLVIGSWVSAKLSGKLEFKPRPPSQTVIAFIGGILLGTGAAIAGGCVIGNILSGLALMSVGNILFAVVVLLTNWAATYFYLMGGSFSDLFSGNK